MLEYSEDWKYLERSRLGKSQSSADWLGPDQLPQSILRFYETVGPNDLNILQRTSIPLFFPSLKRLWKYQEQWDTSGIRSEKPAIVIAGHGSLPMYLHTEGPLVFYSSNTDFVFSDIIQMANILFCIERYLETPDDTGFLPVLYDEDDYIHPDTAMLLCAQLAHLVDISHARRIIDTFLR